MEQLEQDLTDFKDEYSVVQDTLARTEFLEAQSHAEIASFELAQSKKDTQDIEAPGIEGMQQRLEAAERDKARFKEELERLKRKVLTRRLPESRVARARDMRGQVGNISGLASPISRQTRSFAPVSSAAFRATASRRDRDMLSSTMAAVPATATATVVPVAVSSPTVCWMTTTTTALPATTGYPVLAGRTTAVHVHRPCPIAFKQAPLATTVVQAPARVVSKIVKAQGTGALSYVQRCRLPRSDSCDRVLARSDSYSRVAS